MTEFNGTNPLLDALGDQPTIRDVTINNNTSFKIVEPLTGLQIQTETIVRVHGEVAFQQIQNNIVQLNELQQQEAVTSTAVVVDDQPPASWSLTNCTVADGLLTYTGGLAVEDGTSPGEALPSLFASKPFVAGEELLFTVNHHTAKQLRLAFDLGSKFGSWSDGSAVISERINLIQLFNGRSAPQGNIDTTTLAGAYLISMKLQTSMLALITLKDLSSQQELASLVVDLTEFGYESGFNRIWIYAEFETTESQFSIPFTVPNNNLSQ
ncbi:hypothetical protein [Acinetobacter junii]|uniref:hypothetical protein n=1 Tax=Acinetobacter junii TaxID=40215 RepID=UPI001F17749B|nr:hypothetical protein [Acinetobacter junii]